MVLWRDLSREMKMLWKPILFIHKPSTNPRSKHIPLFTTCAKCKNILSNSILTLQIRIDRLMHPPFMKERHSRLNEYRIIDKEVKKLLIHWSRHVGSALFQQVDKFWNSYIPTLTSFFPVNVFPSFFFFSFSF